MTKVHSNEHKAVIEEMLTIANQNGLRLNAS